MRSENASGVAMAQVAARPSCARGMVRHCEAQRRCSEQLHGYHQWPNSPLRGGVLTRSILASAILFVDYSPGWPFNWRHIRWTTSFGILALSLAGNLDWRGARASQPQERFTWLRFFLLLLLLLSDSSWKRSRAGEFT